MVEPIGNDPRRPPVDARKEESDIRLIERCGALRSFNVRNGDMVLADGRRIQVAMVDNGRYEFAVNQQKGAAELTVRCILTEPESRHPYPHYQRPETESIVSLTITYYPDRGLAYYINSTEDVEVKLEKSAPLAGQKEYDERGYSLKPLNFSAIAYRADEQQSDVWAQIMAKYYERVCLVDAQVVQDEARHFLEKFYDDQAESIYDEREDVRVQINELLKQAEECKRNCIVASSSKRPQLKAEGLKIIAEIHRIDSEWEARIKEMLRDTWEVIKSLIVDKTNISPDDKDRISRYESGYFKRIMRQRGLIYPDYEKIRDLENFFQQ